MIKEQEIIRLSYSEFQRYIRGEMTRSEENEFQRNLKEGPLSEGIIKGWFSGLALRKRSRVTEIYGGSVRSWKRTLFFSAAAVVIAVFLVSSALFILTGNRPDWSFLKRIIIPDSSQSADPGSNTGFKASVPVNIADTISTENIQHGPGSFWDTATASWIDKPETVHDKGPSATNSPTDSGLVISDNNQSTADSVKLRDVLTGNTGNEPSTFMSPAPVSGISSFNRYIHENIKKPVSLNQGDSATALISFVVTSTGALDSIKVIDSPGAEFAQEAVRLITEGPAWKPAVENGRAIDGLVKITIVFK